MLAGDVSLSLHSTLYTLYPSSFLLLLSPSPFAVEARICDAAAAAVAAIAAAIVIVATARCPRVPEASFAASFAIFNAGRASAEKSARLRETGEGERKRESSQKTREKSRQLIEWTGKVAPLRSASERKTLRCKVCERSAGEDGDGCRSGRGSSSSGRVAVAENQWQERQSTTRLAEALSRRAARARPSDMSPAKSMPASIDLPELASFFPASLSSFRRHLWTKERGAFFKRTSIKLLIMWSRI